MPASTKSERKFGSVQKQKMSGLTAFARARRIGVDLGMAQLGRGGFQAALVDVADAGDLEAAIGVKSGGVMQPALAHADDDDFVAIHGLGLLRLVPLQDFFDDVIGLVGGQFRMPTTRVTRQRNVPESRKVRLCPTRATLSSVSSVVRGP